ncbi:unnamed protein product [Penicillium pancosmium]
MELVPAEIDARDEETESGLGGRVYEPNDPFVTRNRPPKHSMHHDFDAAKSVSKRETREQAEIRLLKRTIANLHCRMNLMQSMLSRSGPSPAHEDSNSPSDEAMRNSLAAHIDRRIENAIAGVYRRMDRRDAAVAGQFQQQGARIVITEYNVSNLTAWVVNIARQIEGYFTDMWRTTGGAQ